MNAVIGMTGLLLDTSLDAEQRDYAQTIRTSSDALLAIINDILDFSKIEAGRLELEREPFDLRDCVESALDLAAPAAAEKGLELGYLMDEGVPAAIVGDVTRLRQILANLLSNAVKFTEEGEVVVSVAAVPKEGATELHFAVRDTGIGIPADRMDRLFQSFSQVDSSTTRRYGGTGLGLAISRRLCGMMGGRIWAESAGVPGKGSTFHFSVEAEAAPATSRAYMQPVQMDLRGREVLVVDDNATNRRILALQTERWGMRPEVTGSPAEALDWIRQGRRFDVALLDRQMPEMDGLALAAAVRKLDAALPLVMVSSLGRHEAGSAEVDLAAFLLKPIKASQLYDTLVRILATGGEAVETEAESGTSQFDPGMGRRLPLRILLAEDNAVNQKVALRLLARLGYRADVAGNGREAVEALRRQTYDVVLMDVQMPEMDGLEATEAILAEWPPGRRPRIVAMTANVMKEDQEACLAAGMDDYLGKPIRVPELIGALNRCQPLQEGRVALDPGALDNLRAMAGGDTAFLAELIDAFLADAPQLLAEMRQAMDGGDAATWRRAAHSLKSNSAEFGAGALAGLCRELEGLGKEAMEGEGRDVAAEQARETLARVEDGYKEVRAALQAVRRAL
jgi:CheY-like chemotaxis protein